MKHLDLFSGIGGFALAARWCGFETIGFSEIDPYCCKVLEKNFPGIKNYGDIRNIKDRIECDLITGGPPCQPASCAGKRRGPEDDRWLWQETLDCVERFKPAFCLFENPTGLLTLNGGLEIRRVYARMENLGYDVADPIAIPACAVGAGHRRMRVWIAAHLNRGRELQSEGSKQYQPGRTCNRGQQADSKPDRCGREGRWAQPRKMEEGQGDERRRMLQSAGLSKFASNLDSTRLPLGEKQHHNECQALIGSDWPVSPETDFNLLRKVHGVSPGLDRNRRARIKALGNAIVPQVAYEIMRLMTI